LRFLVDVGVGKQVEKWLKEKGYDVKAVRDINPRAKDIEILKLAIAESRMIITMDKDFGELIYKSGKSHCSVLILRLENATGDTKVKLIERILSKYSNKIWKKFCVFQNGRLRIRD